MAFYSCIYLLFKTFVMQKLYYCFFLPRKNLRPITLHFAVPCSVSFLYCFWYLVSLSDLLLKIHFSFFTILSSAAFNPHTLKKRTWEESHIASPQFRCPWWQFLLKSTFKNIFLFFYYNTSSFLINNFFCCGALLKFFFKFLLLSVPLLHLQNLSKSSTFVC